MSQPLEMSLPATDAALTAADYAAAGVYTLSDSLPDEVAVGMECAMPFLWATAAPEARGARG